jgi:hypothetical protein
MITTEDIDRIKYPEIGNRIIEDATWLDLIKDIGNHINNKLKQAKRHVMDILFLGVYFL